LLYWH